MEMCKETLLGKADALLGQARRNRKLSTSQPTESDRDRLVRDAEELEDRAARLEKEASSAKNGIFTTPTWLARSGQGLRPFKMS
jgi:hypothetical protein